MFRSELQDVLKHISDDIRERIKGATPDSTEVTCAHIFDTSVALISGIYDCIESGNHLATSILERSMVEYVIDLLLIAAEDSEATNKQFNNYATMLKFWYSPHFIGSGYEAKLPDLKADYRECVRQFWPDIYKSALKCRISHRLEGMHPTGKRSRANGLLGISDPNILPDATIDSLAAIVTTGPVAPETDEHWKSVDDYMRKRYFSHWSGKSYNQRVERVLALMGSALGGLDSYKRAYSLLSNYTHPTRYTVGHRHIEIVAGKASGLADPELEEASERNLLMACMFMLSGMEVALKDRGGAEVKKRFWDLLDYSSDLKDYVLDFLKERGVR